MNIAHEAWLRARAASPAPSTPQPMPAGAGFGAATAPLVAATVMMVDDEPLMTDLIQLHLEDHGYTHFLVSNDPAEALPLMRSQRPDLLLLDLMMPGTDGFQILERMRGEAQLRYTPVIVLTAATGAEARLRALDLGATDFLAKPVDPSELVLRVRNTLAFRAYLEHTLNHDAVTGLPNRRQLERRLERLLRGTAAGIGLLNVTVDECRQIRDTLGSAAADHLVTSIGERLVRVARGAEAGSQGALHAGEGTDVMRLDSDTFALLLCGLASPDDAEAAASRVLQALEAPIAVADHEVTLSPSIGIAVAPTDGTDPETLIQAADQARSQAQADGGGRYEFFSFELNARHYERLKLGAQLRRAAERDELRLHYQPKVDARTGRIVGAEALLRWQHPDLGLLPPARFIPLAEELGTIGRIGAWVIARACRDAAGWAREGLGALRVAVNVSQPQFENGRLATVLRDALDESGLPADRLTVELTESMLMGDARTALQLMKDIKSLGVSLSIDDFGTGYSSLSYLKRFPIDELKIDRSFVVDLPGGAQDLAIVGTVVSLGHNLGLNVVAEGVEHGAQRDALQALGCDHFQGFLFSRPLPECEFAARVRAELAAAAG